MPPTRSAHETTIGSRSRASAIDSIVIGAPTRELGRVNTLAASIHEHGLVHPVLLRALDLVAGHRRVEACRLLEWKTIPARQVERLSDDALRAIELDENTARENLSEYATSKARLAQIRQAEADLKAKERETVSSKSEKTPKGGRPTKGSVSRQKIAEESGVSETEQVRVERHVERAEAYPFMQRQGWQRHYVLDAGDLLDKLPEQDRAPIAALLDQDAIPPSDVVTYLSHAVDMPKERRRAIIDASTDEDPFVRRTALTTPAAVPPPVDPGLMALHEAARAMSKAAISCRSEAFKPRLNILARDVDAALKDFSAHEKEARAHL